MGGGEGDDVAWGHTDVAERNRLAKARRIAAWCWDRAITASDLDTCTPEQMHAIAGQAHVNPPGQGSTTWHHTKILLERMAAWSAQHPDHQRARHPYQGLRHTWITDTKGSTP
jgi:hypothetical protein